MDAYELSEVRDLVRKHDQTLYGETGTNGLKGTSRDHELRITNLEKKLAVICALSAAAGAGGVQLLTSLPGMLSG
jgi:hypothetical protein